MCVGLSLSVCALKGKRLELSTPKLVHIYSMAVARHALARRSKGQGHMVMKTAIVACASEVCCCGRCVAAVGMESTHCMTA